LFFFSFFCSSFCCCCFCISFFFLIIRQPTRSQLFPYTTLFRSTIKRKDNPSPDPKKSIGGTGRGEGALEFARRSKDAAVKSMKAKQSLEDRKLYNNRVDTYESRVRALVKQKGDLTKIQSGDGRNEYQVRINKLKKENPKEFKKLFKLGGFGNLKD